MLEEGLIFSARCGGGSERHVTLQSPPTRSQGCCTDCSTSCHLLSLGTWHTDTEDLTAYVTLACQKHAGTFRALFFTPLVTFSSWLGSVNLPIASLLFSLRFFFLHLMHLHVTLLAIVSCYSFICVLLYCCRGSKRLYYAVFMLYCHFE